MATSHLRISWAHLTSTTPRTRVRKSASPGRVLDVVPVQTISPDLRSVCSPGSFFDLEPRRSLPLRDVISKAMLRHNPFQVHLTDPLKQRFAVVLDVFDVRILDSETFDSRRRSSCLRSVNLSVRKSLPSLIRRSNAKKQGSPRWKSKSLNCGLPRLSRQTISPSSTVLPSPGAVIAFRSLSNELNG